MVAAPPYHVPLPHLTKDSWRDEAAKKRDQLASLIPAEWQLSPEALDAAGDDVRGLAASSGILSDRELDITELDEVQELASRIAKGTYTAVEVTTAFCKRAAIAQQLTNCLTEIFFDDALEQAKKLDDVLKSTGKPVGPLHGVPVSLKDQFDIAGKELTMGYVSYLGRISKRDSALVALLRDAGAVFHVRTNVPQTLMIGDTFNHLFGRTHNPINRKLSPGGSSGGEGALIAMKGSILGVGTDIGGSVRIPSAFCGLHTIRPSTRRVPYGLATNSMLGQEAILSVPGPMARSLASCTYFSRIVFGLAAKYDATALPFKFDDAAFETAKKHDKLSFGVIRTDLVVTPTPPVKRALDLAVQKLRDAGHEVLEFDWSDFTGAWEVACELYDADGGEDFRRTLAAIDEPLIEGLIIDPNGLRTTYEVWQINRTKEALQQAFLDRWMASQAQTSTGRPFDGLLCPAAPIPAPRPLGNKHVGYTAMFNLLDAPCTVFPVTKVDPAVDKPDSAFKALTEVDQQIHDEFDSTLTAGLPVALQVVGQRWRDEEVLAVGQIVADIVGSQKWEQ
ncbi:uncharacterized protein RHOBADRAFT_36508 [Rhodotorula graminis WP1]|uniref:amidase n=1 Tax=Rhodotorula graminis (strain WP1) TaxID=578459 RepID=A0A194S5B9_RHOGW|nr:uncharacterized protein RHOBADRAFT_36508 [Rhodotorula graminis WP1]KPV74611.1 hypothetical protein RHOBADRAFT_36508 [Rhodotorula graminis WP1]